MDIEKLRCVFLNFSGEFPVAVAGFLKVQISKQEIEN